MASSTYVSIYRSLSRSLFLAQPPIYTINYSTFPALRIGTGKCVLIKQDKCASKQNSVFHQSALWDDELHKMRPGAFADSNIGV